MNCLSSKYILGLIFLYSFSDNAFSQTGKDVCIGVLVSAAELAEIRSKALKGVEPYRQNYKEFLHFTDSLMETSLQWPKLPGEVVISGRSSTDPIQLSSTGAKLAYGTAIAWHLTGEEKNLK
ncbi:MAG: hypothetical protein WD431_23960 [Cyclobacteriaceae bacterium]